MCSLGRVVGAAMRLSHIGNIVRDCWRDIPSQFYNTKIDTYQIMPNHVHGIVEIMESTRRGLINQTPTLENTTKHTWIMMKHSEISLGKVIRAFKARTARLIHKAGFSTFKWQRNYYDHIIRDDVDHFMIQQYIELNPLFWEYDIGNPQSKTASFEEFENLLKEQFGIHGNALYMILSSNKMNRIKLG